MCTNKGSFSHIPKDSPRNFRLKEFLFHCPIKTIKTGEGAVVIQKWLNMEARQGRGTGYPESTHTLSPGSPPGANTEEVSLRSCECYANDYRRKTGTFGWFWTRHWENDVKSGPKTQWLNTDPLEALKGLASSAMWWDIFSYRHYRWEGTGCGLKYKLTAFTYPLICPTKIGFKQDKRELNSLQKCIKNLYSYCCQHPPPNSITISCLRQFWSLKPL